MIFAGSGMVIGNMLQSDSWHSLELEWYQWSLRVLKFVIVVIVRGEKILMKM